jgi:hypothetical protein
VVVGVLSFVGSTTSVLDGVGRSDFAPAKALPKRLFPPALNLGLVSLPLTGGARGGGSSEEVGVVSEDEEVVKPDIRDASEAIGSVSLVDVVAKDISYKEEEREGKRGRVNINK